jgi:hypothetical protein
MVADKLVRGGATTVACSSGMLQRLRAAPM